MISIMFDGEDRRDLVIKKYFNSNWIRDHIIKKLTLRFIFMLNDELVSWCLKRQIIVALLSIKAEYITLTLAVKKQPR